MTDQEPEQVKTPPPPRRKASPKRTPPPSRRGRAQPVAGGSNGAKTDDPIAALVKQNQELMEQLKHAAAGGMRTIEYEPESKIIGREADDEELTEFQRELKAITQPTPEDYTRKGLNYNYPLKFFAKPDGSIVRLQGDPGNRSYYRDKGFVELTDEQVVRYLKVERLPILKQQQQKAKVINDIRRVLEFNKELRAGLDPKFDQDCDHMTIPELEDVYRELVHDESGKLRIKLQRPKRLQDADDLAAQRESDRMLAGVETSADVSMEEFHAKLERGRRSGLG